MAVLRQQDTPMLPASRHQGSHSRRPAADQSWSRRLILDCTAAVSVGAAAAALAACDPLQAFQAPPLPPAARGVIEFQTDHTAGPRGEITDRALELFGQDFPAVRVDRRAASGGADAALAAFAAGTAGDLKLTAWSYNPDLIERSQLTELTALVKRDRVRLEDLYGVAERVHVAKGKVYGLPYQLVSYALMYNKTLLQRGGVPFPTSEWTWDDLLEAARRLTVIEGDTFKQIGFTTNAGVYHNQGWGGPVLAAGGRFVDDEGRKTLLDQPVCIEPFTFAVELVTKHRVCPVTGYPNFNAGRSALDIDQIVEWGRSARVQGLEFDIVPVPKWRRTNRRVTVMADQPHVVPKSAQNVEGAWALAKYLTTSAKVQEMLAGPQRRGFFPVLKAVVKNSAAFREPPPANIQAAVVEGLEAGMPIPTFVGALQFYAAIREETTKAYRGEVSPIEALRAATRAGDAAIAAARGTR